MTDFLDSNTDQLQVLVRRLRNAQPQIYRAMQKGLRAAGQVVADDARRRTTSKKVQASLRVSSAGTKVTIRAGGQGSPLPALLEGDGTPGTFRAPNFPRAGTRGSQAFIRGGHDQRRQPYLHPALEAKREQVGQMVTGTVTDTLQTALESGA